MVLSEQWPNNLELHWKNNCSKILRKFSKISTTECNFWKTCSPSETFSCEFSKHFQNSFSAKQLSSVSSMLCANTDHHTNPYFRIRHPFILKWLLERENGKGGKLQFFQKFVFSQNLRIEHLALFPSCWIPIPTIVLPENTLQTKESSNSAIKTLS